MIYVYLFYGLAFIALGLVMALQARSHVQVLLIDSLWILAVFGFLHGAHEWVAMAVMLQGNTLGDITLASVQSGNLLLNGISFAFLMQFGIELAVRPKRWPVWSRWIPASLVLAVVLIAVTLPLGAVGTPGWVSATDALFRYVLGFPGSLVAAYSLIMVGSEARKLATARLEVHLLGSAVAFAAYSVFSGLIVPPAPFFPAYLVNTETFVALTRVPVEVLRGICAAVIGGFLAEAFVVETGRTRLEFERLREEFIAVIAHDLRSPITTVGLSADFLERLMSADHVTESERAVLSSIRSSARSLNRMVEDLLDASRIEARRLTLAKESVNLGELIYDVVGRATGLLQGHQVKVTMPETVPPIEADPARVDQILVNLLSNAAKYSFADAEILVETEVRSSEVMISVTNYGPGMTPDEIPRLFTRFYRTREAGEARIPGLGLGLYIAKGLVEAHGGRIWAESEAGKRATFHFTLPYANE